MDYTWSLHRAVAYGQLEIGHQAESCSNGDICLMCYVNPCIYAGFWLWDTVFDIRAEYTKAEVYTMKH